MAGTLHLIPLPIHTEGFAHLSPLTISVLHSCDVFFCENLKTARRFVKAIDKNYDIDAKHWHEINKHNELETYDAFLACLKQQTTIGIMSEAGCPAVADPGSVLVAMAHTAQYNVVPLTGPSSIMLALMASGFNGQRFMFEGYLPIDAAPRQKKIQQLESDSKKNDCTIIFIEAPYRNAALFTALLQFANGNTKLCIAANLTSNNPYIKTLPITAWKKIQPPIQKEDTIFLLYAN
jgi:16S rRNA (cytidine1402-2'-O)-methyltransferase